MWVTILLLVFVVGPIFTNLTLGEYFTNATTYKYLLNGVFVLQHPLPGVFSQNIYQGAINGALWTLPIEFICYIGCFIALKLKLLNKKSFIWTLPLILAFYTFFPYFFSPDSIIPALARPVTLFYLGIGAYVYRDKIVLSLPAAFVCLAVLVLSIPLGIIKYTFIVFFPYFIFTLGFRFSNCANFAKRQGEWSYGIYLWGCPIQQMVLVIFPTMSVLTNILVSLPLAIIMGGLLYWLVEKPVARISKSFKKNNC